MEMLRIQRDIYVSADYDVVVCGGGPAGIIAAISAARCGRKTAIVERLGFFGGTATGGMVVPISGFYYNGKRVVGGISWELVRRLEALGAAKVELPKGHISVNIEYYKLVAQQMLIESGVELYTNSYITDCEKKDGRLTHIIINSKGGCEAIGGKCFIDATGDGDLCAMADVPMLDKGEELQPVSLCFLIGGVDTTTELLRDCIHHDGKNGRPSCNAEIREYLLGAVESGIIEKFGGPWFNTLLCGDILAVNVTREAADVTDRASYTKAECRLREDMYAIIGELKKKYPEFAKCEIVSSGVNAGVRESRRIKGVATLTLRDLLDGKIPECAVAHAAHPMDIHSSRSAAQSLTALGGDAYVPCEVMVAQGFDNLIAAGRCISSEKEPYASIRVQGTLMSIGEAAGLMADLYCTDGRAVYDLDLKKLKSIVAERGFVL